jgi:outer membrane protein OmpA-like peptidoglycan-associated protein/tetratricopeptide (TPR) repeat protein
MKRFIYLLAMGIILSAMISCQPIYKAQKQMDKYNYAKAIEILKKAEQKEKTHDAAVPMLAECYRQQHDMLNAKSKYAEAVALPGAKAEDYLYYAQALQADGDYTQAREMFLKYSKKKPSDPKGKLYVAHCDSVLGPWKSLKPENEVKLVSAINTEQSEFGPAIYNGDLVFASDFSNTPAEGKPYGWTGRGYLNIMKSSPQTAGDYWGNMGATTGFDSKLNQAYHDGPAAFSADGNSIYFTRSFFGKAKREGIYKTNLLKIYYAQKVDGKWGEVKPFFLNSLDFSVGHPTLSSDGQTLYFVSDMPGGIGGTDIWMCKREGENWSKPLNLGKVVNTAEDEMFPTMNSDGVLYFSSNGHAGYGSLDIFSTKSDNGNWTTPKNLQTPVNGAFDDFAVAFALDHKIGFFSSNRPGGVGSDDIYAFRALPAPLPAFISGFVKDKNTLQPIAGATVFVYEPKSGKVKVLKTDANGMYKVLVDKPEQYVVKGMMINFIADCSPFPLAELKPGTTSMAPRDLLLDKLMINKTFSIENIYYDFDKYNIRKDAQPQLDDLVRIMKENPVSVELGSHTDCRGSFAYNDKLSQRRAESAVNYIVKAGIEKERIAAKGYGENQLVNKCSNGVRCTSAEHQANRRTEFKVTSISVPSTTTEQFELGKYSEGQELESKILPVDFFNKCK